jgi:hypothetical protein
MANRDAVRRLCCPRPSLLLFVTHHSLLLFTTRYSFSSFAPDEERAERRWRSDACEAPVSARHDRRADASSISCKPGQSPPCVHCAPRVSPGLRSICANRASKPDQRRGILRSLRRDARLSALHVGFLARARAGRCPAFPPGSCADLIRRTGHRDPEERVSRTSHGAVANRLRGRHSPAPPYRIASRRRPSGARMGRI